MGRVNKLTDGVFSDIVGTGKKVSSYDEFISHIETDSPKLTGLKKTYEKTILENKKTFMKLAKLEEIILQTRSKESLLKGNIKEMKLSLVREYIYARFPFYRKDVATKDIRVIVDKTDVWGDDLNVLMKKKNFIKLATEKLVEAMDKQIDDNMFEFKKIS